MNFLQGAALKNQQYSCLLEDFPSLESPSTSPTVQIVIRTHKEGSACPYNTETTGTAVASADVLVRSSRPAQTLRTSAHHQHQES
ncbi:hypothetical protein AOLI_G00162520 [Acnodon oligacanthus]